MRVLAVGPTGVVAMQRVLDWLAPLGHQVWIVDYANHYRQRLPQGWGFSPFFLPRGGWRVQEKLRRVGQDWIVERVVVPRFRAIARRFRPDVVHLHNLDYRGYCCAKANLHPLIASSWGALSQLAEAPERPLPPEVSAVLPLLDVLIVDSPALVAPAQALTMARVEHLPLGTDTRWFKPGPWPEAAAWRRIYSIPDNAVVLLSPRKWASFYGHQSILRAFALAFPRFQQAAVLAFVGLGNGPSALPHMAEAWQEVGRTEAALAVRWLPPVDYRSMPTLYAMADIVINYPARDSFPVTLVEAAACGLPVITAMLPTYRGTFVEELCHWVAPDDVPALANKMVEVVNQPPDGLGRRQQAARRAVQQGYDDRVISQRLLKLYAATKGHA
ncbi:MAG: glycosyltransferase family 4 protein [Anaerolineae bacterium]